MKISASMAVLHGCSGALSAALRLRFKSSAAAATPWWRALAAKEPGTRTPYCPAAEDSNTVLPRDDPYTLGPRFGGAFPVGTIPHALNCPAAEAPLPPIPDIPFTFWPRFGGVFSCPTIWEPSPAFPDFFGAEERESLPRVASRHDPESPAREGGAFSTPGDR